MFIFLLCFLLTVLVYKSQQRNRLFIYCMDVIPGCQLPLDWTVGSSSQHYDRRTRLPRFKVGDRVFVYMPAAKACKAYKFARPFYGPYRIVEQSETGVVVRPVDRPQADPIRVAYNRIRHCADSIPDVFWPTRA